MSNVRFMWNNARFDAATISASPQDASFPFSNVKLDDPGVAYKSGPVTGDITFSITMLTDGIVDAIVFAQHTLEATGTITVNEYSDAGFTTLVQSQEFNNYDSLFGYGDEGYGEHGYGGVPAQADLDVFPRLTRALYMDTPITNRYIQVVVDNNNVELAIGRMFACPVFEPEVGFVRGHRFTLVDNSVTTRTYAGNKITDEKEKYYQIRCSLPYLGDGEAYGQFLRLINRYGIRRPFVAHFVPIAGEADQPYTIMYGRFLQPPPITSNRTLQDRSGTSFTFEEEI